MDELVKKMGFENLQEFHRMVASVRLTLPGDLAAFNYWKENDGTKEGLSKLPMNSEAPRNPFPV